ncbi:MAG: DUF6265 family protein [Myxococcaceae bacterium]
MMMSLLVLLAAAPPPLELQRTVTAKPGQVWSAWATAEGVKTFLAPDAKIELKPGGAFEPYFAPEAPAGMKGADGCTVVSVEKGKTLVFTWNFPPSIPSLRGKDARTQVTVQLAEGPRGTTVVTLTQTGWQEGADWEKGRVYFERAWGMVLARLDRRFRRGPIDWKFGWAPAKFEELAWMQGHWRGEGREETWSATPTGLTGMYRGSGQAPFYELSVIEREGEELVLSMRMFDAALKDSAMTRAGPLRFVLESVEEKTATFVGDGTNKARLSYRLVNESSLEITLQRPKGEPEVFTLARLESWSSAPAGR